MQILPAKSMRNVRDLRAAIQGKWINIIVGGILMFAKSRKVLRVSKGAGSLGQENYRLVLQDVANTFLVDANSTIDVCQD